MTKRNKSNKKKSGDMSLYLSMARGSLNIPLAGEDDDERPRDPAGQGLSLFNDILINNALFKEDKP